MSFPVLAHRDPLVVLGVDPGSYNCGFGVVGRRAGALIWVDHGVIRARRDDPAPQRLRCIFEGLQAALDHHRPDALALENVFVKVNVRSALRLGEARAAALLAAALAGVPVVEYATAAAKKAVAGSGAADKTQVAAYVARHLGIAPLSDPGDATDALALALCFLADPRLDPRFAAADVTPARVPRSSESD